MLEIRTMFHDVWELERFQVAKVTFKVIQGLKDIGNGAIWKASYRRTISY